MQVAIRKHKFILTFSDLGFYDAVNRSWKNKSIFGIKKVTFANLKCSRIGQTRRRKAGFG
jgi:hypothetical protein